MSNIIYASIDDTYPVAGQDNDTQGFRDNFNIIKTGLSVAKSEITSLETRSILSVSATEPPTTVDNDLLGSTIRNGVYSNMRGLIYENTAATGAVNVVTSAAPFQIFTLTGNTTFKFTNWPTAGQYAKIRLHIMGSDKTATFVANGGETLKYSTDFPLPLPFTVVSGHTYVIDVWCYDYSTTVFLDLVAEFA